MILENTNVKLSLDCEKLLEQNYFGEQTSSLLANTTYSNPNGINCLLHRKPKLQNFFRQDRRTFFSHHFSPLVGLNHLPKSLGVVGQFQTATWNSSLHGVNMISYLQTSVKSQEHMVNSSGSLRIQKSRRWLIWIPYRIFSYGILPYMLDGGLSTWNPKFTSDSAVFAISMFFKC